MQVQLYEPFNSLNCNVCEGQKQHLEKAGSTFLCHKILVLTMVLAFNSCAYDRNVLHQFVAAPHAVFRY